MVIFKYVILEFLEDLPVDSTTDGSTAIGNFVKLNTGMITNLESIYRCIPHEFFLCCIQKTITTCIKL